MGRTNDLGVDCISRADAIKAMQDKAKKITNEDTINGLCGAVAILYEMPSVTPQEPVLDKIREEIKRVYTVCHASNNHDELIRRNVVLQIIDKYKAESEVSK